MNGRLFSAFVSTQTASYVGSLSAFRLSRIFSVLFGLSLSLCLCLSVCLSVRLSLSLDLSLSISLPRSLSLDWEFESDQYNVFLIFFLAPFSLLDFVIYCTNVWNEREADNTRERRDFEDDEVKSHLGLSSAQPFIWEFMILS